MARRKRRLASRVRDYVRGLLAFLFSNVGVVVLVLAYTIAGAFMFQAIEGAREMERSQNMTMTRDRTAQHLWENVTLALNLFNETALKERIGIEIKKYQERVVKAVHEGWDGGRSSRQWSFSSAFLYSLTVITTIGYGHLSPRTNWGKVITIFYALLGMPLFLLYLTNVGELLARWFKCIYALICLCRGCPGFTRRRVARLRPQFELSEAESIERPQAWRTRRSESQDTLELDERCPRGYARRPDYLRSVSMPQPHDARYRAPDPRVRGWSEPVPHQAESAASSDFSYVTFDAQTITVPISVCVSIMVGIGFGDFVPGERVYTPRIETSFIVCSLYLMLGMALVAMCFNLMQEQVLHYIAGLKRAFKRLSRCKR
ncbi:potassium two pore domain channel sandman isoform X2 [Anticarsia gemmatalis]|uniref:potassium two pore domain channel sandman isoform X2 n=1 Tax=Anticarsia gemmatalis TaxID=129554 RepID=UPI003F75F0F3